MSTSDHPSPVLPGGVTPTPPASSAVPLQQALALHPSPGQRQQNRAPQRAVRPQYLWLGIHLPALPLDALRRKGASAEASAVFEEVEGVRRILLANRAAERQGITAGLSVNTALALAPALELLPRESWREPQVLEELAAWAERFTSLVSIEAPDGLLLEVAGSLRLFGGSEALQRQVESGLHGHGFTAALAIAPTPLASAWLARSGKKTTVTHTEYLAGALGPLPLHCLRWPLSVCESLNGMGITSIDACLRLPRQGFARRFGAARLLQLDRALGRLPDPRASHRSPERFCREYELEEEQDDRERLLAACRHLLDELERFLTTRQVAVQRLKFGFFHLKGPATHLRLGSLELEVSAGRWFELLALKLDRMVLPAPVITIRLESGRTQAFGAATGTLPFDRTAGEHAMPVAQLIERLAARIGDDCVHGVTTVAEHRPHHAWRQVRATGNRIPQSALPEGGWNEQRVPRLLANDAMSGGLLLRRPLWMLAEPLSLTVEEEVPQYQGPLRFENGPERLETGWWDDHGIARDYFTAVNPKGVRLWIYCNSHGNRHGQGGQCDWYLHGIFD